MKLSDEDRAFLLQVLNRAMDDFQRRGITDQFNKAHELAVRIRRGSNE